MLNELIETCQRGQQEFAVAADQLAATHIKNFFFEQSQVRAQFGADLLDEMHSLNASGDRDGFQGSRNAGFDLAEHQETGIVEACRSADAVAIRQYEQALNHPLPATLRSVIEYQYRSIKQAQDQLKMWDRRDGA